MGSTCVTCGSGTDGGGGGACCSCRECCNVGEVRAESCFAAPSSVRGFAVGGPVSIALLLNLAVDPNFDINELAHFKGPEPTRPRCMSDSKPIATHREHVPLLTILPRCCNFRHWHCEADPSRAVCVLQCLTRASCCLLHSLRNGQTRARQ